MSEVRERLACFVEEVSAEDGEHSPGVKRQWSGTLGKIDNCQIAVSVHAVGQRGTLPLGFALYLPVEWCDDLTRRRKAKIPDEIVFQTKNELAAALCGQAAVWAIPRAPILADAAYGDDTAFRARLHESELEYAVAVSPQLGVFGPVGGRTAQEPLRAARASRRSPRVYCLS